MIRRLTLVRRSSQLTHDQFLRHWRGQHAELAKGLEGLRGYRLNAVVQPSPGLRWDGVAELWFDSIDAAAAAFSKEPLRSMIAQDSAKLLDEAVPFFVDEYTIIEPAAAPAVGNA